MFKRPRLSAPNSLVNALPALVLLFLVPACSQPADTPTTPLPDAKSGVEDTDIVLPAVWSTRDLGSPVASIALADALGSTIAVAFQNGDVQFIDFEGERITEKVASGVRKFADGRYLMMSGVPVTIFPAINLDGDIQILFHGGDLSEPISYDLDTGIEGTVVGLCTAPPQTEADGVIRIGFWTAEEPNSLQSGRIVEVDDALVFLADEPVTAESPIAACLLGETGATVFSAPARAAASLKRRGRDHVVTLDTSGNFSISTDQGPPQTLGIKDGITIRMPVLPIDMAGTGDTRSGGYPGGMIIIAGVDPEGEHLIVFVDASKLTLTPFAAPDL